MKATGIVRRIDDLENCHSQRNQKNASHPGDRPA